MTSELARSKAPSRRVAGAVAVLVALLAPAAAWAQSKSDAFAGKIPPVSAELYRKAGRFEATLSGNVSVNDAFYSKYFGGLKLGYHFTESWSAHALLASGLNTKAGSAQVCPSNGGCRSADKRQMYQVPGNIKLMAGLEGAWTPIYGKLNLFSGVVHFDMGLMAGVDWINHPKVLSETQAESGASPSMTSTVGGHLGLGTRIFINEWLAARLEFRDYLYRVSVPNWREGSGAKKDLQNQMFAELGISVFFPMHNRPVQ